MPRFSAHSPMNISDVSSWLNDILSSARFIRIRYEYADVLTSYWRCQWSCHQPHNMHREAWKTTPCSSLHYSTCHQYAWIQAGLGRHAHQPAATVHDNAREAYEDASSGKPFSNQRKWQLLLRIGTPDAYIFIYSSSTGADLDGHHRINEIRSGCNGEHGSHVVYMTPTECRMNKVCFRGARRFVSSRTRILYSPLWVHKVQVPTHNRIKAEKELLRCIRQW